MLFSITILKDSIYKEIHLCEGDSVMVKGTWYFDDVIIYDSLVSVAGCDSLIFTQFKFNPNPLVHMPSDTGQCEGQEIVINIGNQYPYVIWNTGDTASGITITAPGTYTALVIDFNNCSSEISISASFFTPPISTLQETMYICKDDDIALDPGNSSQNMWYWSTGDTTRTIIVRQTGIYWVTIYNNDCKIIDTVVVKDCKNIVLSNVITPNSDGFNDFLYPVPSQIETFDLWIYDRWGALIYHTNSTFPGWDGTKNSTPCEQGVYYYLIKYSDNTGSIEPQSGAISGCVQLLR